MLSRPAHPTGITVTSTWSSPASDDQPRHSATANAAVLAVLFLDNVSPLVPGVESLNTRHVTSSPGSGLTTGAAASSRARPADVRNDATPEHHKVAGQPLGALTCINATRGAGSHRLVSSSIRMALVHWDCCHDLRATAVCEESRDIVDTCPACSSWGRTSTTCPRSCGGRRGTGPTSRRREPWGGSVSGTRPAARCPSWRLAWRSGRQSRVHDARRSPTHTTPRR